MIFGTDVSRYQDVSEIDGWAFAIINVEDPGCGIKVEHCRALGIPWGLYTWIYPGNGRADMNRALASGVRYGEPPLGFWLDYEQAGVSPRDLDAALDCAADRGALDRTGVYTYLYMVAGVAGHLRDRPLWLAYYPGANSGTYPATQDGDARRWGAVLWQYSSGGNLDRNVVIDEAWYQAWISGEEQDMTPDQDRKLSALFDRLVFNLGARSTADSVDWICAFLGGVPGVYPDLTTRLATGAQVPVDVDEKQVAAAIVVSLGDDLARKVADEIAERLKS